jgi:2-polyprenyl-3-methyl-5-hydroxy-6-metoxy-1,4-benzoquinol methylase
MNERQYLMEHNGEIERLETKTDENTISRLATWAGLKPGMEVADVGCGIGKTTAVLQALVGANGRAVGIDASEKRIEYAREKYPQPDYCIADVCDHVDTIGQFDFIWSRFLLEYHKSRAFTIVQNLHGMLKPGGILCTMISSKIFRLLCSGVYATSKSIWILIPMPGESSIRISTTWNMKISILVWSPTTCFTEKLVRRMNTTGPKKSM